MREYRVFGPPGTGKTTSLQKNAVAAADKHGWPGVMITSFTKAAATEIKQRIAEVPEVGDEALIPDGQIGTLHSILYQALGRPDIAELKAKAFDEQYPNLALAAPDDQIESGLGAEIGGSSPGARLMAECQLLRHRMVDRKAWPDRLLDFAVLWDDFKAQTGYLDFTDLLETGLADLDRAPGDPVVGFVDEAQDLSVLQLRLVRRWAEHMDHLVLYSDDDQTLFSHAGADPSHLIADDIPPEQKKILSESHRLPRTIFDVSQRWIEQCSNRQPKAFIPTWQEGSVAPVEATWGAPEALVRALEPRLEAGQEAMILATCSYMLGPTIQYLRDAGHVFHNPYRRNRGDWNPWNTGAGSTVGRIAAFLRADESGLSPDWTWADVKAWSGLVKSTACLRHGAKKAIDEKAAAKGKAAAAGPELFELLADGPWTDPFHPWSDRERLFRFLETATVASRRKPLEYVVRALARNPRMLDPGARPKLIVGTIHSVKGGEALAVAVYPDLSREAAIAWAKGGAARDAVIRTLYVGMTRAQNMLLCPAQASPLAVNFR